MAKQRALITGATGFVGSHLARRLVVEGWDVHVVVRPHSDLASLADVRSEIKVHVHDGTTEGIIDIISLASPRTVFHLASLFLVQHEPKDIASLLNSNVLFSVQLAEAMVTNNVHRLVNTGTSWQHYKNRDYDPVNLYAATKQAFEDILAYYSAATPLCVITLQLCDTYGQNDPRHKLFNLLAKASKSGEPLLMSPGEQLIDLVYIDDVVEAYLYSARLLEDAISGHQVYAVSSGNPIKLRDLVTSYEKIVGTSVPVVWGRRPYRPREVMSPWTQGKVLDGWSPRVSLVDGIRRIAFDE